MAQLTQAAGKGKLVFTYIQGPEIAGNLGRGYHGFKPAKAWTPAVNVYEDAAEYTIVVDLAGLRAEDIDLRPEGGVLRLAGRRPSPCSCRRGAMRVHLMEIDRGEFFRELPIPDDVDVEGISASYRNGLLYIRMPRMS